MKLHITWLKSGIGFPQRQKDTLRALGLRRLGQTVEHENTPTIRGMIRAVQHLLKVKEIQE